MLKVKARSGESVQIMIKRFKKLCEKEGLIRDMKRNSYYEKPSEKNRRRMRKGRGGVSCRSRDIRRLLRRGQLAASHVSVG